MAAEPGGDPLQEQMDMVNREVLKLSEALLLCQRELAQVRAGQEDLLEQCSQSRVQSTAATETSQQLARALAAQLSGAFWERQEPTIRISIRQFIALRWPWLNKFVRRRRPENPELQQLRLIEGSDLFQPDWYLQQNPDVALAGIAPAVHYLRAGASEGRDPSPAFGTRAYIAAHPDVAGSGTNPLVHHLQAPSAHGA